jgi:UPF0271 protein
MSKVVDSAAFINSSLFDSEGEVFTTSSVIREIKDFKSKALVDTLVASGKLRVFQASKETVDMVKNMANDIGALKRLSRTDIEIVSLAFEKNAILVTDDFTLQNLAAHLNVKFDGVMRGKIREKRTF